MCTRCPLTISPTCDSLIGPFSPCTIQTQSYPPSPTYMVRGAWLCASDMSDYGAYLILSPFLWSTILYHTSHRFAFSIIVGVEHPFSYPTFLRWVSHLKVLSRIVYNPQTIEPCGINRASCSSHQNQYVQQFHPEWCTNFQALSLGA